MIGRARARSSAGERFPDTEEVTGSNPVAPTTVLAGHGPFSTWRTALLTRRGRAAAAGCCPPNRVGPPELDDTGPPLAQRPHSVVTISWSGPMVEHHAGDLPRTPCGAGEYLLRPHAPRPPGRRPGPGPAPVSPGGEAAPQPGRRPSGGLGATVDPRGSQARPTPRIPFPSGPMRAGDHAARGPRRRVDPLRPTGTARPTATPGPARRGQRGGSAADTGGLSFRTPGWHRTRGRWMCRRWTSARPVGRTSPRRDRGRGQGNDRPGVRTSSRPATIRWAARPRLGSPRLGALDTQDGSAVTAPAPRP
jgi:hypothetical protein